MINSETQSEQRGLKHKNEDQLLIHYTEITFKEFQTKKIKPCHCSFCCCLKTMYKIMEQNDENIDQVIELNEKCKCWKYIKGKINFIITFTIISLIFNIMAFILSIILIPQYKYVKNLFFRQLEDIQDVLEDSNIQPKQKFLSNISNYQIGISITNIILTILLIVFEFMQKCKYYEIMIYQEKKQGKITR